MKKTLKIQKFIEENRTLYEIAINDICEIQNNNTGIINASYVKRIDSNGEREGYSYRYNGNEYLVETDEDLKNDLANKGYGVEKAGYHMYTFKNEEIANKYNADCEKIKKINEGITDARKEIKNRAKEFLFENYNTIYVRFGDIPKGGKSYNFRDNFFEKGVSVYKAAKVGSKYYIDVVGSIFTYSGLCEKNAYEVSGEVLTTLGSDGEPLLVNPCIVKKLSNNKIEMINEFLGEIYEI